MVKEGIVLEHLISEKGKEVDKAMVEVIEKMSPPSSVKEVRSFLEHIGFYRRFIKDFYKIAKSLTVTPLYSVVRSTVLVTSVCPDS